MNCGGDDCRRMHCRGVIRKQTRLDGTTVYLCNKCGQEYSAKGASINK